MNCAYTITPRSISVMIGSRMRVVNATQPNFEKLRAALRVPVHNIQAIEELVDLRKFVARVSVGRVQVADDEVRWDGQTIHSVIAARLIEMLQTGDDMMPMAHFMDRVMTNPVEAARLELFQWLEAGNAPITPDGYFLAFKAVRSDYRDIHSGRFDNSIGQVVQMPRDQVDGDRRNECSQGLHFCQYGYLSSFAHANGHIMIVKIDPADVVAIPEDYQRQKGRCWRYEVVGEVPQDEAQELWTGRPVVSDYSQSSTDLAWVNDYSHEDADVNNDDKEVNDNGVPVSVGGGLNGALASLDTAATDYSSTFNAKPTPRAKTAEEVIVEQRSKVVEPSVNATMTFKSAAGATFTSSDITDGINRVGSLRGWATEQGLSKSTVQGWVKKINA